MVLSWNYCMSYIISVSHLCKPVKYCDGIMHISTKNKSFSWPSNKPWCDWSGQEMGHLVSPRGAPVPLPCAQTNAQSSEGQALALNPLPLHRCCALMEQGIINHLPWEMLQDLRGAVSFQEEVSPQLGWRGARRSQAGRDNCFGSQNHLHSHIWVAPGSAALPSCWDYTAFSLATCTTSCKTDQIKCEDFPTRRP